MAKRRRKSRKRTKQSQTQRGRQFDSKIHRDLLSPIHPKRRAFYDSDPYTHDRRYFKPPHISNTPRTFKGQTARIIVGKPRRSYKNLHTPVGVRFAKPEKVITCHKRKKRRETLFKARKIGKGIRVTRKRIRDRDSQISCK